MNKIVKTSREAEKKWKNIPELWIEEPENHSKFVSIEEPNEGNDKYLINIIKKLYLYHASYVCSLAKSRFDAEEFHKISFIALSLVAATRKSELSNGINIIF